MRYRAEETERSPDSIQYRLSFPPDSGLFEGHFPGNPILPGVAQVQVCAEVLARSLAQPVHIRHIESVRYRKPVTPDLPCTLSVTMPDAAGRVDFRWHGPDGLVAEGRLHIGGFDA